MKFRILVDREDKMAVQRVDTGVVRIVTTGAFFGYPCYEGTLDGNRYEGKHVGIVGSRDDAKKFLSWKNVRGMMKVYPSTIRSAT